MSEKSTYHMSPEEFRRYGYAVIDWIADYQKRVETLPVLSRVKPGEVRAMLPLQPPDQGEDFETILADIDRVVMPGMTHWNHPRFFAYFSITGSGPGILGELLSAAFDMLRHASCDNASVLLHMLEVIELIGQEAQAPEARRLLLRHVSLIQAESEAGDLIEQDRQAIQLRGQALRVKLADTA